MLSFLFLFFFFFYFFYFLQFITVFSELDVSHYFSRFSTSIVFDAISCDVDFLVYGLAGISPRFHELNLKPLELKGIPSCHKLVVRAGNFVPFLRPKLLILCDGESNV